MIYIYTETFGTALEPRIRAAYENKYGPKQCIYKDECKVEGGFKRFEAPQKDFDVALSRLVDQIESSFGQPREGEIKPEDERPWHGKAYSGPLEQPVFTWRCEKPPRDDHRRGAWLTASEFTDTARATT